MVTKRVHKVTVVRQVLRGALAAALLSLPGCSLAFLPASPHQSHSIRGRPVAEVRARLGTPVAETIHEDGRRTEVYAYREARRAFGRDRSAAIEGYLQFMFWTGGLFELVSFPITLHDYLTGQQWIAVTYRPDNVAVAIREGTGTPPTKMGPP